MADDGLARIKKVFNFLHDREIDKLQKLSEASGEDFTVQFVKNSLKNLVKVIPNSVDKKHIVSESVQKLIKNISRVDDLVSIELHDGTLLKTFESRQQYRNYYYCFRHKLPSFFSPESYQACCDISFRYLISTDAITSMINIGLFQKGESRNIIECGAYNGWKALGYSKHIGPGGKILVLEIDKKQYDVTAENLQNNLQRENYIVLNKGVWNKVEEKEYTFEHFASHSLNTPDEHDHHTQAKRIVTDTLDNIIDDVDVDVFDFINIQTGGSELESVQGLDRNLSKVKVMWLGTHYQHEGETIRYRCMKYLLGKGCRIYYFHRETGETIEVRSIDEAVPQEKGGFYAVTPAFKDQIIPKLG